MAANCESLTDSTEENPSNSPPQVEAGVEVPQIAQSPIGDDRWPHLLVSRAYKTARKLPKGK